MFTIKCYIHENKIDDIILAHFLSPQHLQGLLKLQGRGDSEKQHNDIFLIRQIVQTLQPGAYNTLYAIIDHLTKLLEGESEQRAWEVAGTLASCLAKNEEVRCRLLIRLMLRYRDSVS